MSPQTRELRSVEDLIEDLNHRRNEAMPRFTQYDRARQAYFGRSANMSSQEVRAMDSTGRVTDRLQRTRDILRNRTGAPNILAPIVDDYVALRGPLPTIKVLPEDPSNQESKDQAAMRGRVIRAQYTNSNMDIEQFRAAWHLSVDGDVAYCLHPRFPDDDEDDTFQPPGVYITVVDPHTAFPRFRTGYNRLELDSLFVVEVWDAATIWNEFGHAIEEDEAEVVYYYDRYQVQCIVETERHSSNLHQLGFCPAQWVPNRIVGQLGQSDLTTDVLDAHEEFQVQSLVMADSLIEATYAQKWIKNPSTMPDQIEVGPGAAPIVIEGDGSVGVVPPANQPQNANMIVQSQQENLQHMTGSAPLRTEGKIQGSNISGRSLNAVQGPMETRLAQKQVILGQAFQRINAKISLMFTKLEGFGKPMRVYGQEQGTPFSVEFTGEEMGGWTLNRVSWPSMIGSNFHERVVTGLQLKGAGLAPDEWVLEQLGMDDPELMIAEARADKQAEMAMQQQAQQGPQGPPGQGPPPQGGPEQAAQQQQQIMQPADQAQGLAMGATPPSGSPQAGGIGGGPAMPDFPPLDQAPNQPGMGPPPEIPDTQTVLRARLAQLAPQLKGNIVSIAPQPGGYQVVITSQSDVEKVKRALREFGKIVVTVQGAS